MATYTLKRIFQKLFSGIGRSGYPRYYVPVELENSDNLPVYYEVKPLGVFVKDLEKLPKKFKSRLSKLIKSLNNGYLFENSPDDPDEYTHARPNANEGGWEVYSKDIDHEYRFIYGVKKPIRKIINGELSLLVPVRMVECMDHDNDQEIKDRIKGTGKKRK